MNTEAAPLQRIARLTPLRDAHAAIDAVPAVPASTQPIADCAGAVLACDVVAPHAVPEGPRALRDGWAVSADLVQDAGSYAPVPLDPATYYLDAFADLPAGSDTVIPHDAVEQVGGLLHAVSAAAPGDGVLPASFDAAAGAILAAAGHRLMASDIAALTALGIGEVQVRRPRIVLAGARDNDIVIDAARRWLADALRRNGSHVIEADGIAVALEAEHADAVIGIGGTGSGRRDNSVNALARIGRVSFHGVAISPGETAAFGHVKERPVVLCPGRFDAVMACWLLLGHRLLDGLSGHTKDSSLPAIAAILDRKVTSTIGLAEIVPLALEDGRAQPLGTGVWPLNILLRAQGWLLVPPDSEGFPDGTEVTVHPWP